MFNVEDKVAIVTGGGQGIGAEIARTLAARGAKILVCDIKLETCESVAAEMGEAAVACGLDVRSAAQWENAVKVCEETLGPPTVLVNNAGIADIVPFEETSEDLFDRTMAVNVKGVFLGMQAVFESMKNSGGGSIINISSGNGFIASMGVAPYVGSKFAVRGLTRSGAFEWGKHGIRVNAVCPGMIKTPMMNDAEEAHLKNIAPLERIGMPADIASIVLFLASNESSYATGSDFLVDGGIISGVKTFE